MTDYNIAHALVYVSLYAHLIAALFLLCSGASPEKLQPLLLHTYAIPVRLSSVQEAENNRLLALPSGYFLSHDSSRRSTSHRTFACVKV
jgi:hypothetical protein